MLNVNNKLKRNKNKFDFFSRISDLADFANLALHKLIFILFYFSDYFEQLNKPRLVNQAKDVLKKMQKMGIETNRYNLRMNPNSQ
jgi:hypothetical protein